MSDLSLKDAVKNALLQVSSSGQVYNICSNDGYKVIERFAAKIATASLDSVTKEIVADWLVNTCNEGKGVNRIHAHHRSQRAVRKALELGQQYFNDQLHSDVMTATILKRVCRSAEFKQIGNYARDVTGAPSGGFPSANQCVESITAHLIRREIFKLPEEDSSINQYTFDRVFTYTGNALGVHKEGFTFSPTLYMANPEWVGRRDSRGRPNTRPTMVHVCPYDKVPKAFNQRRTNRPLNVGKGSTPSPRFLCRVCKERVSTTAKKSFAVLVKLGQIKI